MGRLVGGGGWGGPSGERSGAPRGPTDGRPGPTGRGRRRAQGGGAAREGPPARSGGDRVGEARRRDHLSADAPLRGATGGGGGGRRRLAVGRQPQTAAALAGAGRADRSRRPPLPDRPAPAGGGRPSVFAR